MPKSKLRGGAKTHRKRVQNRKNKIKGIQRKMQEEYNAEIMKQLEDYKQQMSANTENKVELESAEKPLNIKL